MTVAKHTASTHPVDAHSKGDWATRCDATNGKGCWCETKAMADVWRIMTDGETNWSGHAMEGTIVSCSGAFIGAKTGGRV